MCDSILQYSTKGVNLFTGRKKKKKLKKKWIKVALLPKNLNFLHLIIFFTHTAPQEAVDREVEGATSSI